jgi:hypothetical protein
MLLALIVWIGGIIFFAFVLAPTLFGVLPTTKLAGDVVNATLGKLHWMGLVSGVVFLICSLLYNWQKHVQLRPFALSHIFVVLMLVFTTISQFGITPRMRELRSSPGLMDSSTGRAEFDRLHAWSTRLEGGFLFLGLGVVLSRQTVKTVVGDLGDAQMCLARIGMPAARYVHFGQNFEQRCLAHLRQADDSSFHLFVASLQTAREIRDPLGLFLRLLQRAQRVVGFALI